MNTHQAQDCSGSPLVLIVGATGGFGGALARSLLARGWAVRALTRHADMAERVRKEAAWRSLEAVQWQVGDAMSASDMMAAAKGAHFVVHAANPPRYQRWRELALPMLANSVAAARAAGARLVLPGNIYNFGPDAGALLSETSPQHPLTGKGQVRVEMERILLDASQAAQQPLRSLVLRAGDFFGGHAPASWFGTLMLKPGQRPGRIVYPGPLDVGHAWVYLPDMAETAARLMALDLQDPARLARFEVLHLEGHWLARGGEMAESIRRVLGQPDMPIRPLPWALLALLTPFVGLLREIREMRYLWNVALKLDNRKLVSLIGPEPHTPLDNAVRESLVEMGCLQSTQARSAWAS